MSLLDELRQQRMARRAKLIQRYREIKELDIGIGMFAFLFVALYAVTHSKRFEE